MNNVITWDVNRNKLVVKTTQKELIKRIYYLKNNHPKEVFIQSKNNQGLIANMPLSYLHLIRPKKKL